MQCPKCKMMVPAGASQCMICKTPMGTTPIARKPSGLSSQLQGKFSTPLGGTRPAHSSSVSSTNEPAQSSQASNIPAKQSNPSSPTLSADIESTDSSSESDSQLNFGPLKDLFSQGGILDRKFKLGKEIGRGGMGYVYLATDLSLNRQVAVKILPPHYNDDQSVVGRFQREARAMASLDHPNIVTVYSIGFDVGLHYFVMKYLKGETLAHTLKRVDLEYRPPVSALEVIDLMVQACNGLEHAHDKSLLHRDIKPGNLMLSPDGFLTIMDFGIVKRLNDSDSVGLKTAHGKIFGTPEYMPPEQAMGKGDYSPASDLYALAVVGYELLCGELPYIADTPIGIIIQHIRADVPSLKGRAKNNYPIINSIFKKALAKEPSDRYDSASSFRAALLGVKNNLSTPQFQPIDQPLSSSNSPDTFDFIDEIDSLMIESDDLLHSGLHLDEKESQPPIAIQPSVTAPMESVSPVPPNQHFSEQAPSALTPPPSAPTPAPPPPSAPTPPASAQPEARATNTLRPASERPGHYKGLPFKRKK